MGKDKVTLTYFRCQSNICQERWSKTMTQITGRPAPEFNLHSALRENAKCSGQYFYQFSNKSNLLIFRPFVVIKLKATLHKQVSIKIFLHLGSIHVPKYRHAGTVSDCITG
jgi:hypothetical protein